MSTDAQSILSLAQEGRFVVEDFTPLADSLEWLLGQQFWRDQGSKAFISESRPVPYVINNDGNLSRRAAELFFSSLAESESKGPLEPHVFVLELGIGVGLFARFFLDAFRDICSQHGKDFYRRLQYIAGDRSERMLADACRNGIFASHPGRYLLRVMDAIKPGEILLKDPAITGNGARPLRAVFTNYVLDCLPVAVTSGSVNSVQSFTWAINTVELANPGDQTSNDSQPVLLSLAASDSDSGAITYSATGLPTGLTINASDGLISGTIGSTDDATGTYNVTVTATDGSHAATQSFVWTINSLPTITINDQGDQSNLDGDSVFVSITAADPFGSAVSFSATGLPSGLTINSSNGIISGTIGSTADASSPYSVTITATDAEGNTATDTFNWTVAALSFTAPGSQINSLDMPVTLDLLPDAYSPAGSSLTFTSTGLPAGLWVNSSTGVISGTPLSAGNYLVNITVSDATHDVTGTFAWQISTVGIADPEDLTSTEGQTVSLQLAGVGPGVVAYSASGLPDGLSLNCQTGLISGTISAGDAANGPYTVDVSAIYGLTASSQTFTWTINPKVSVTAINDQTTQEGQAVSLQVEASETGATLSYSAYGLPTGLTINASTGMITGTISADDSLAGPYYVTITVSDGTYSNSVSFNWNTPPAVTPAAPVVQNPGSQTSYAGQGISLNVNASDAAGYALDFNADNLPDGLSIDPSTGIISGTNADDAVSTAPYEVSVTVDDGYGDQTTKNFWWTVNPASLTIVQTLPIAATEGADTGTITLASFTTTDTNSVASDFTATVYWGDGTVDPYATVQGGNGSFTVADDYTYYQTGTLPVSVVITNNNNAILTATATTTATIADAALNLMGGYQLGVLANQSATLTLAAFTDGNPNATASDFTATVYWGDGTSSNVTLSSAKDGLYQITAPHSYSVDGTFAASIYVTDAAGVTNSTTSTVVVGDLFAGIQGTLTLATFTDTTPGLTAADFTVGINWGDGDTGTGTVTQSGSTFTITAAHTFATDSFDQTGGVYQVALTVDYDSATYMQSTLPVEAVRPPAALYTANIVQTPGGVLSNIVAAIWTESNTSDSTSEFNGSINWGDSTTNSGTVQEIAPGLFELLGSHTYSADTWQPLLVNVTQGWSTFSSFGVASTEVNAESAQVQVTLPSAQATVMFNGHLTTTTGTTRTYETPPLDGPGTYTLRVSYQVGGYTAVDVRQIVVTPGNTTRVDFTRSSQLLVDARIRLTVPTANATVTFDGRPTTSTGMQRVYSTPPLATSGDNSYLLNVSWRSRNGEMENYTIRVIVAPGSTTTVDLSSLPIGPDGIIQPVQFANWQPGVYYQMPPPYMPGPYIAPPYNSQYTPYAYSYQQQPFIQGTFVIPRVPYLNWNGSGSNYSYMYFDNQWNVMQQGRGAVFQATPGFNVPRLRWARVPGNLVPRGFPEPPPLPTLYLYGGRFYNNFGPGFEGGFGLYGGFSIP